MRGGLGHEGRSELLVVQAAIEVAVVTLHEEVDILGDGVDAIGREAVTDVAGGQGGKQVAVE